MNPGGAFHADRLGGTRLARSTPSSPVWLLNDLELVLAQRDPWAHPVP